MTHSGRPAELDAVRCLPRRQSCAIWTRFLAMMPRQISLETNENHRHLYQFAVLHHRISHGSVVIEKKRRNGPAISSPLDNPSLQKSKSLASLPHWCDLAVGWA